jgi:hypothetical protein
MTEKKPSKSLDHETIIRATAPIRKKMGLDKAPKDFNLPNTPIRNKTTRTKINGNLFSPEVCNKSSCMMEHTMTSHAERQNDFPAS